MEPALSRAMHALATVSSTPRVSLRECSEQTLLELLIAHHQGAWGEFIRRYRALMFHCINRVVSRYACDSVDAEADEIYGEVLVMLLENDMRKLRMFNPERGIKLGSWIGMLSTNAAHDYLRCASRRPWLERLDPDPEAVPNRPTAPHLETEALRNRAATETPLDRLLEKERWTHLEEIVADFSRKDQQFLHLYYTKGMDAFGVARRMAVSIKTVYTKKHKIREHLRRGVRNAGRLSPLRDLAVA